MLNSLARPRKSDGHVRDIVVSRTINDYSACSRKVISSRGA